MPYHWNVGYGSFRVIENGTIWLVILVCHCKWPCTTFELFDIAECRHLDSPLTAIGNNTMQHSTHCNYLYLVPFLTYSTLNNGLPLDNWVSGHSGSPINAVATHLIQVAKAPHDKKFECQVHMQGRTLLQQMSDKSLPHLFTEEEISAALQKTKPATAPGYDNIHVEFLKNLGPKARTWLSKFFSRIMATHSIPKIWRKAKVIAVENVVKIWVWQLTTTQSHCCVCVTSS